MKTGTVVILLFATLLLAGCMTRGVETALLPGQVDVFGVEMGSREDYRSLKGVEATEEPCLHGYERSFDSLDVAIGYGFDKRIRKIFTRNTETSLFDIKPGMPLDAGRQRITAAGFREQAPSNLYRSGSYSLKLLVESDRIVGLVLEQVD